MLENDIEKNCIENISALCFAVAEASKTENGAVKPKNLGFKKINTHIV